MDSNCIVSQDSFQERSRSTAGFQEISCSMASFQEKSQSTFEVQDKSRGSGYVQVKFQLKSRKFNSSILLPLNQNSPRIDEDEFLRQLAHPLFNEQFYAFLNNIKELNDGKQPLNETLRKAYEIFGTDNRDLYLTFEELVKSYQMSYQHPWSSPINVQNDDIFFRQARNCLLYKNWFLSFQRKLISSQESSATNSPPRETSDSKEFIPLSWSQEFIRLALIRLPRELFDAMVGDVMELNDGIQTVEETLRRVKNIFGTVNEDLFLSLQELLRSKIP